MSKTPQDWYKDIDSLEYCSLDYSSCKYSLSEKYNESVITIYDDQGRRVIDTEGRWNPGDYLEYIYGDDGNVSQYIFHKNGVATTYTNPSDCEKFFSSNCGAWDSNEHGALGYSCYAKGTQITLFDGTTKNVEDVCFEDELLVWNFDEGKLDKSKPLWIKKPEIAEKYNLLTFSDGSILKTINQHRIFNKEAGKYTYPMTDDTPIGTTTLKHDGTEVTLVSKEVINEPIEYYNIITNYHMNCFASGISTSCRLNNLYPIKDYKFEKDDREFVSYDEYKDIPYDWYEGLRLAEQPRKINRGNDDIHANSISEHILNIYIKTNDETKHLSLV